jgi:hypothetical protein
VGKPAISEMNQNAKMENKAGIQKPVTGRRPIRRERGFLTGLTAIRPQWVYGSLQSFFTLAFVGTG